MATEFHQTIMGRRFYEQQLPNLIKAINAHTEALNKNTEIMQKMLENKNFGSRKQEFWYKTE